MGQSTFASVRFRFMAAALVAVALVAPTGAQEIQRRGPRRVDPAEQPQQQPRLGGALRIIQPTFTNAAARGSFSLARDSDAEQWLKKAVAAGDRQEWKLAIDTLWRIIDQYGDAIVSSDGKSASAASELAWNMLRDWPPAALETYRTLYEPEAARLLADAEQRGDVDAVRGVARKYLLTPSGAAALDLLATWMLDQGRPFEAAAALRRLRTLPPPIPPRWSIDMRLAAAESACGRTERAKELIRHLSDAATDTQPADALPPDYADRVKALVAFVDMAVPGGRADSDQVGWFALLGGGPSTGRMPAVDPSFASGSAWKLPLPGAQDAWSARLVRLCARAGIGPVWQIVADAQRVFARCPTGVLAVDATTFDVIWKAQSKPRDRVRFPIVRTFAPIPTGIESRDGQDDVIDAAEFRALTDELAGTIAVRAGLVFSIEPPREMVEGSAVFQQLGAQRLQAVLDPWSQDIVENSLHAFDAETGKLVWSKGADGPIADGLAQAHFTSAPVACGDRLVAPFINGENFCLAVFQRDGRLIRIVTLGSAPPALFPARAVLQPTLAEPLLYVPTGCGVLLALGADDLALRWSATYSRDAAPTTSDLVMVRGSGNNTFMQASLIPPGWAANPPVVVGDRILLAAPDSSMLIALDRETGQSRWTAPRDENHYVVGCDERYVFLSGTKVSAVDLNTGDTVWTCDSIHPTGRPALSGTRIFVPTRAGVAVVDSANGKVRPPDEQIADSPTCGNLLAWDGSLYSLSASALERVPDLAQSVAQAEARLKKRQDDRAALLRLAVLEYQRGNLARTRELLSQSLASARTEANPRLDDQISHLWVQTNLELARNATTDRDPLLQAAAAQARRPGDVLRVELALIDLEQEQYGPARAFERGLALLLRIGDSPADLDGGLVTLGWVPIAERLERLWAESRKEDRATVDAMLRSKAQSVAAPREGMLLADALGFAPAAAELDLAIGSELLSSGSLESADFFLSRAARRSETSAPDCATRALVALIALRAAPPDGAVPLPEFAANDLARLKRLAAQRHLTDGADLSTRRFIDDWSKRLGTGDDQAPIVEAATDLDRWGVIADQTRGSSPTSDPLPTLFQPANGSTGRLAILGVQRKITAIDTRSDNAANSVAWSSPATDSWTDSTTRADYGLIISPAAAQRRGAIAGVVAVVPSETACYPIGLATGRSLGPALSTTSAEATTIEPRVAAVDDWFVAALDDHTLVGWPARDWSGPVWRREIPRISIASVRAVDGLIVVANREQDEFVVLRPTSGRIHGRIRPQSPDEAAQPGRDSTRRRTMCVGSFICTAEGQSVAAWHVASGRAVWKRAFTGPVVGLTALDSGHVGVSWADNRLTVLDVSDGRAAVDLTIDDATVPPLSAVIDHGVILLFMSTPLDATQARLSAYDGSTGSLLWTLGPLNRAFVNDGMLRASPQLIPYIETTPVKAEDEPMLGQFPMNPRGRPSVTGRLGFIDKVTGSRAGRPIVLKGPRLRGTGLILDVGVFASRIFVTTADGYFIVGPTGDARPQGPDFDASTEENDP